jgi:hypothetical protein
MSSAKVCSSQTMTSPFIFNPKYWKKNGAADKEHAIGTAVSDILPQATGIVWMLMQPAMHIGTLPMVAHRSH